MATAIGFYAGEGSNPAELAEPGNKELIVIRVPEWTAPAVVRENLTEQFLAQRFPTTPSAIIDYLDDIVLVSVIDDDGTVRSGEQYDRDSAE
jgi:hypothetical protein